MDKGNDYPEVHELLEYYGYTIHIPLRGEHRANCKRMPRYRAKHWIVERTHPFRNNYCLVSDKARRKIQAMI
jgi:hypothetical protein